ncbi:hypothetical protein [uncultured Ruthenibacterium sp.]|uniref:hypothetical protein n=1 Tax=uncultured Ruthenibacterium sp. TaxID=1905347 RepID=UPI00349E6DCD
MLEPLAGALEVTIAELISGERASSEEYTSVVDSAVKNVIEYSESQIAQKVKSFIKKAIVCMTCVCLLLLLLLPTLNGLIRGDGFAWQCIPAYLCAQKAAKAIETGDEQAIQSYIGNSEGMFSSLSELNEQGITIRKAEAKFWRTRLDDMFLLLEVDFIVIYQDIKYQFTCSGTYRNGKVEFMNIVNPGWGQEYPEWILQLNDALSTYDPG